MYYSLQLVRSLLFTCMLLLAGIETVSGQSIEFKRPELALYNGSGLPLAPFQAASAAALDSLSRQYGIPLGSSHQDGRRYRFVLTSQITPNLSGLKSLKMYSKFPYKNTIVLSDAESMREVIRVENYPKDLLKTSQNADSLASYYRKLYNHSFHLMAGFGSRAHRRAPVKHVVYVQFEDVAASADRSRIIAVVKDAFLKNQEVMPYRTEFALTKETGLPTCQIKVSIARSTSSHGMTIRLLFPADADLDYHGNPIPTEFTVNQTDLKSNDFSFLLGKMTATIYKFSEVNFN